MAIQPPTQKLIVQNYRNVVSSSTNGSEMLATRNVGYGKQLGVATASPRHRCHSDAAATHDVVDRISETPLDFHSSWLLGRSALLKAH